MKYFPSGGIKILTVKVAVTADKTVASTATRTTVPIKDLPMPVMLVEGKQPEMMGSRRLNEVL